MKKKFFVFSVFLSFCSASLVFPQERVSEFTSRQIADESVKKGSPQNAAEYIKTELGKIQNLSEKRSLYAYLGSLYELMCDYAEAQKCYVSAAGISARDAEGMAKKSNEELVLDAVRCALCAGEGETALSYLNSAVRNSKSEEIQAKIKLYEEWAKLSLAENSSEAEESIALLKAYSELSSMKSVKPSVLLTLWYTTGEKKYSETLLNEFPDSAETGIVTGKVQILPTPFWFFLPKHNDAEILHSAEHSDSEYLEADKKTSSEINETKKISAGTEQFSSEEKKSSADENARKSEENHSASKLQLGLFKSKENAVSFVAHLSEKGFSAYIQEETRGSGTVYYIVLIDENPESNMGLKLKSAGFESYPVF